MTTAAETVQRMLDEQRAKLEELTVGSAAAGYVHIRIDTLEKVLKELTPKPEGQPNKNLWYGVVIHSSGNLDGTLVNLADDSESDIIRWTRLKAVAEHWQIVQTQVCGRMGVTFEVVATLEPKEWKL